MPITVIIGDALNNLKMSDIQLLRRGDLISASTVCQQSKEKEVKEKEQEKTYILHSDILSAELECSHLYWRDLSVDLPLST